MKSKLSYSIYKHSTDLHYHTVLIQLGNFIYVKRHNDKIHMEWANDKAGWKEDGKVIYSLARPLFCWTFCRPSFLSPFFQVPFLPFHYLSVCGWHNLVFQGIITLHSDSKTVSGVHLVQHNYPSHKAGGNFEECGFVFFCITLAERTSLLLQYFNTVKAT